MAKILVTGAAGFIGSHTVDLLLREGHTVIGVDNLRTGHRANLKDAERSSCFQFHQKDISEPDALFSVLAGSPADSVIHLAALVSVQESIRNPDLNFRLNIQATHLVAEAARNAGVNRIVFASSAAIYGDAKQLPIQEDAHKKSISPYGAAKLASEDMLHGYGRTFGITTVCQRYFNVFGPRQDPASPYSGVISIFAKSYTEGRAPIIFGDGQQSRDFISVYDVARANMLAATTPDLTSVSHNICTGRKTTLLQVADTFAREFPALPRPRHEAARSGDIVHSYGDPMFARVTMGFAAEIDVSTGLRKLIAN